MDALDTFAHQVINKLLEMIVKYEEECGEAPKSIRVSDRAYLLLEQYASENLLLLRDSASGPIAYFKGIEVRIVTGEYYDIFLSGDP